MQSQGVDHNFPVLRLRQHYQFKGLHATLSTLKSELLDPVNLVASVDIRSLILCFPFLMIDDLRCICQGHNITTSDKSTGLDLTGLLLRHNCGTECSTLFYHFKVIDKPRKNALSAPPLFERRQAKSIKPNHRVVAVEAIHRVEGDDLNTDHLRVLDFGEKMEIIREWQDAVNTDSLTPYVCAVCSIKTVAGSSFSVHGSTINLTILQNSSIPVHCLPTDYSLSAYNHAILNRKGLSDPEHLGFIRVCCDCLSSLRKSKLPKFALANFLYYGINSLPANVQAAIESSSIFERMLVCRARSNNICCRFNSSGSTEDSVGEKRDILNNARRGIRGNVMVAPLDIFRMHRVLPPTSQDICDSMCAVFVGDRVPSRASIAKYSPVLVRKSRVKTIIQFLLSHNPYYRPSPHFGFSQENMDKLHNDEADESVPFSVRIDCLPKNDAILASTSDYTPRNEDDLNASDEVLMENVGYTDGDDTPASYRQMKLAALQRCLAGKPFLASGKGTIPVSDFNNPAILTWLLPHLDPWGIGGFFHPRRHVKISMREQVAHLLLIDESPFERDPEFAFIFYNTIRKASVASDVRFSVSLRRSRSIVNELRSVDPVVLGKLSNDCLRNPYYQPTNEEEKQAFRLLASLGMLTRHIPGSDGYKHTLRHQIRSMIYYRGTPTLFITLNPSDVDNPIVQLYAGTAVDLENLDQRTEQLTSWQRRLLAAKHPAACALFFDLMIRTFIRVILKGGSGQNGLYGKCDSYYGTVEAQGKGTLHCHMLIWLRGHSSPKVLKERMAASEVYRDLTLKWLESVIHSHLPIDDGAPVVIQAERRVKSSETGSDHPGTYLSKSVSRYNGHVERFVRDFRGDLRLLLNEYNWHVHQATCWKYLERHQEKRDENCRMGMNGQVCAISLVDPETSGISLRRLHPMIAFYSDLVVYLMRCNMDIKFVGSGDAAKAFVYYVTDYITKPSLTVHAGMVALSYAVGKLRDRIGDSEETGNSPKTLTGAVITAVNSMMGRHEISHPQVMSYLIGGGDHYTLESFAVLHWASVAGYVRKRSALKSNQDAIREHENAELSLSADGSVTFSNQLLDYVYRPESPEFESLCLYDFVSLVSKQKYHGILTTHKGSFSSWNHPQRGSHIQTRRRHPVIPVVLGPSIPNPRISEEARELWARDMMTLFSPWRSFDDLDPGSHTTWTTAFEEFQPMLEEKHKEIIRNIHILSDCKDARSLYPARSRHGRRTQAMESASPAHLEATREVFLDQVWSSTLCDAAPDFLAAGNESANEYVNEFMGEGVGANLDRYVLKGNKVEHKTNQSSGLGACLIDASTQGIVDEHSNLMTTKRKRKVDGTVDDETEAPRSKRTRNDEPTPAGIAAVVTLKPDTGFQRQPYQENRHCQRVIEEMNLRSNREQLMAFLVVAKQILSTSSEQLLMFMGGVGGTGKSHVIRAIVRLFELLDKRDELVLGAPTGIAAVLIGGRTLHSLIMANPHGSKSVKQIEKFSAVWKKTRLLICDEVSMVGANLLSEMSGRMRQGRGDDPASRMKPFGGTSVLFTGDFGQLKPPLQKSLYAHEIVSHPSFSESRNNQAISAMNGVFLWWQVNTVIELVQNQRQREDPTYAAFLFRLREGKCRKIKDSDDEGVPDDLEYVAARLLSCLVTSGEDLSPFAEAPIIVGSKSVRDALNRKLVLYHAERLGEEVHMYHSKDTFKRTAAPDGLRDYMWGLGSQVNREAFGRLPLFVGMKVMVTENVAFDSGVVNGSEGVIRRILFEEDDNETRYASVVYVHIPGCGIDIPGLDADVVPIFPVNRRIDHEIVSDAGVKITGFTRRQIPLVPGYVYTDFKSQGRTLDYVIVDLATARGQGVYVMLSRVRSLRGLMILRWFPPTKLYRNLPAELREELRRLGELAETTQREFADIVDSQMNGLPKSSFDVM